MPDMATRKRQGDDQGRRPEIPPAPLSPQYPIGDTGVAIYGGHLTTNERDGSLIGARKYQTLSLIHI